MGEPVHGRHSTYTNHGCRCDLCRAANAAYNRRYLEAKPEKREAGRAASREAMRRLRARRRAEANEAHDPAL